MENKAEYAVQKFDSNMSLMELGSVLSRSKYFVDSLDASQAVVKVLAGRELGIGPIASMSGVYIVKGKPSLGANLIAACVKKSGRYNYRVVEHTDTICRIKFFELEDGKMVEVGESSFSIADAKKAGTQNLDKFPRNMLFARAMSNGAKWYCADIFAGGVYTPDELGATVQYDEAGDIKHVIEKPDAIEAEIVPEVTQPETAVSQPPTLWSDPDLLTLEMANATLGSDGVKYGDCNDEDLRKKCMGLSKAMNNGKLNSKQQDEHLRKLRAANMIITARSQSAIPGATPA